MSSSSRVLFLFWQWSKRPKSNLSYKKQDSDDYKVSDQEQPSLLSLPHPIYVSLQKNKNNRSTKYNSRITKIHLSKSGGRQDGGKESGNGTGRKSIQISPEWGRQMLEKNCRKTCGPFRLTGVENPYWLVSGRFCLYMHRRQKSGFLRENGVWQGSWQGRASPSLGGNGGEPGEKDLPQHLSDPTHLL